MRRTIQNGGKVNVKDLYHSKRPVRPARSSCQTQETRKSIKSTFNPDGSPSGKQQYWVAAQKPRGASPETAGEATN